MVKRILNSALIKTLFSGFLFLMLLTSCDISTGPETMENYGIANYEMIIDAEDYGVFDANEFSNMTVKAKMIVDGKEYTVSVRHQGNTTRGQFKKNYAVEFESTDPTLGCRNVILSSQQSDPSMLRSRLSNYLFKEAGIKTFNMEPVTLNINGTAYGLYYIYEVVDEDFFLRRGVNTAEQYKAVWSLGDLSFKSNKEIKDGFKKCIPDDENYYTLEQLILLVDNPSDSTFLKEIETRFDVDKYLRYMAVSVLISNYDGIIHNFYLNRGNGSLKYEIVPWDLNITFDHEGARCAIPGTAGMINRLVLFPKYKELYRKYIVEFMNGSFAESNMNTKIDEMKEKIRDAYNNDRYLTAHSYNLDKETDILRTYIKERHEYIKMQLNNLL